MTKPSRLEVRLVVTGGRDYTAQKSCWEWLDQFHANWHIDLLMTGGARGVDSLARCWAGQNLVPYCEFPADWNGPLGRGAGPQRNHDMLRMGRPTHVVAFPGGRGTEHCFVTAQKMRIPARRWPEIFQTP